jgi:hypothetical protein
VSMSSPLEPGRWARLRGTGPGQLPYGGYGNGLTAKAYAPFLDPDPTRTRILLLALRRAGVAAYAARQHRWRRTHPVVRVWVDVARRPIAEEVVRTELPRQMPVRLSPDPLRTLLPAQPGGGAATSGRGGDRSLRRGPGRCRRRLPAHGLLPSPPRRRTRDPGGAADQRLAAAAEVLLRHHQQMLREAGDCMDMRFSAVSGLDRDRLLARFTGLGEPAALRRLRDEVAAAAE